MEICDNCGKGIKDTRKIFGNVDDGYYCSEKCWNELYIKKFQEEISV